MSNERLESLERMVVLANRLTEIVKEMQKHSELMREMVEIR